LKHSPDGSSVTAVIVAAGSDSAGGSGVSGVVVSVATAVGGDGLVDEGAGREPASALLSGRSASRPGVAVQPTMYAISSTKTIKTVVILVDNVDIVVSFIRLVI